MAPQPAPEDLLKATRAALGQKDYHSATNSVEAYLGKMPRDPEAWLLLGQIHFECGSHADALAAYSKAMELNPGDYRVWFNIGELYSACEQHQDAQTAYTHALSLPGVDIDKLQARLEATQANMRVQTVGETHSAPPPAQQPAAPPAAPAATHAQATPAPRPQASTSRPQASNGAPKPAPAQPAPAVPLRSQPQPSTAPSNGTPAPADDESAYTVIPPRLQAGNYESSRGESNFSTMGGATVHNPKQSLPAAKVSVTTGAGNMGKFTCLTAPLSTLQEHTVPSQLQQTPTLHELLQETPRALQKARAMPEGDVSLQVPVLKGGTIWLLPVSVLRLWFLLAISDHSRHTAHKLYPDQHPPPPGLPPIHYNLLSADARQQQPGQQQPGQQARGMEQHGGVKRPRDLPEQPSAPAYHHQLQQQRQQQQQVVAPAFPGSRPTMAVSNPHSEAGVTVSQVRAMFGARFPNRMRGKKGVRLMGVPPPSENTSPEQEDRQQAAAVYAMATYMGTASVNSALLTACCGMLGAPKPSQAGTPAASAALPHWAQSIVQNVHPAVAGVELRLVLNEQAGAPSSHRMLLRVPAWPHTRRVQRRDARLARLMAAGAQDVQPEDEISSVDTVIDENDERLIPVQPQQPHRGPVPPPAKAQAQAQATNGMGPGSQRHMDFQQAAAPQPHGMVQHGWGGPRHAEHPSMPPSAMQGDSKPAQQGSQAVMSARDFMQSGSTSGMHAQMPQGMPRGSGAMDMHLVQGQGMHMGAEGMYGGHAGAMGHYGQQGGPPQGMHPGMGMQGAAGFQDHPHQQYAAGPGQAPHMQGQHYGSPPPPVQGAGYDERAVTQQQQQHMRGPGGMPPSQGYGMYAGQAPPMQQGPEGGYPGFSNGMPTPYHGGHAPPPHGHPSHQPQQQYGYGMPAPGQYYEHPGGALPYGGQAQGYPPGQPQGYGAPPPHFAGQHQYYR